MEFDFRISLSNITTNTSEPHLVTEYEKEVSENKYETRIISIKIHLYTGHNPKRHCPVLPKGKKTNNPMLKT